jgi:sulfur-oxidizing protein SoxA
VRLWLLSALVLVAAAPARQTMIAAPARQTMMAAPAPHSGYDDASPAVQAMQDDDTANPAMLWVQQGAALWNQQGCASCHGAVGSMRGVAARYPRYDAALGRPITLGGRVNQCRTERQHQSAWAPDSDEMLAVTAIVGMQSRGMPVAIDGDGPARPFIEQGRAFFTLRQGQLNLSCAQCHDGLAGQRLGGARIPQGQPNGYPLYRLEWQSMGSLDRRLRNCLTGVRAEVLPSDSPEMAALQFYLGWRSNGLKVETPAVRP